jgi:hypothetical protein
MAIALLTCAAANASTNLLPGLMYYAGKEPLSGKLTFLLRQDYTAETNSRTASSIYEFDLARRTLCKLTDSPAGHFHASGNGDTFCVIYSLRVWGSFFGKTTLSRLSIQTC